MFQQDYFSIIDYKIGHKMILLCQLTIELFARKIWNRKKSHSKIIHFAINLSYILHKNEICKFSSHLH